ncbi:MAG: imidazoleglycerol-phosphate dehydratase HisB [Deltaproteobacteria bacterium]|jgi:imidazoleglycerol-phosphate dehydratase|nr:imidazoleglycerol-phosphate dehydratase HisB [Deltaproteobacteria bacterium]
METRVATIERKTKETEIKVTLNLDGGEIKIQTPAGFFGHMLTALTTYAGWGITLESTGDTHVDQHHIVEDTGLVIGDALASCLGDNPSHVRYGSALIPMDDALAEVALDAGRRPFLVFDVEFPQERTGDFEFCLVEEFFRALISRAGWTLHITGRRGKNSHHLSEAIFKAVGLAAKVALAKSTTSAISTKGVL